MLRYRRDYDAIAFTGVSGAAYGFPAALRTHCPAIVVRKTLDDGTHSCHLVEGPRDIERYCIVDDFIASGDTVRRIIEQVSKHLCPTARLTHVFLAHCDHNATNNRSFAFDTDAAEIPVHSLRSPSFQQTTRV
jgi:adenine/guanine phosphoribosyltransferase-like PRPP-binding protein